jgi:hypothetical protein
MADLTVNGAGVVCILDDAEIKGVIDGTVKLGGAGGLITGLVGVVSGLTAGVAGALAGVLGAYCGAQAWLIQAVNRGCGVYLTLPWPAIWFGQVYLIIPTTRPCLSPGAWSTLDSGELRTEDPVDRIAFAIDRGAVALNSVRFDLELATSTSGWKKELHVPAGSPPYAVVNGKGATAGVTLAASQLASTSQLTFKKAKAFGIMTPVLGLRDLGGLAPGDRVRFAWTRDT